MGTPSADGKPEDKMMDNMDIYNRVRTVPDEAQKKIGAGRLKGMTDINPMWRIKALTELYGPCGTGWYIKPTNRWMEHGDGGEIVAFVEIELYVRDGDGWSAPIFGTGGSKFVAKEKGGLYTSDECYKMATTDAISVACKMLGMGADVYWQGDRTKYDMDTDFEAAPKASDRTQHITQDQISRLAAEAKRTGVDYKALFDCLHVTDWNQITLDKFNYAMGRMAKQPTKQLAPTPEEGLPFV